MSTMTTFESLPPSEAENRARLDELLATDWALLVNGDLVLATAGRTFPVISPIDGSTIAKVPDADTAQAENAVRYAAEAFPEWAGRAAEDRADLVRRMADVVEEHLTDLALLDAVDGGAPIGVMAGDVRAAVGFCRYFAGLALEMKGESVPSRGGGVHFTTRQPYGVVVKIIPFNHPILFAVKQIAAPLVAGNTVVLKPAEATPLSALHLARLIKDVFPPGVVQVLVGDGPDVPRALVRHPAVHRIGFTGSERTGRSILLDAAEVGIKHVTLELGGKNALIAYPDADPEEVATGAVRGMNFTWSGQSCGSTSRLLVHEDIADAVVMGIVRRLEGHVVGSPLDPHCDQGPLVSQAQYERVLTYIAGAREDGAHVVVGGARPDSVGEQGFYVAPTVLDHVDPTWRVANEEIFGPVLSVIRWDDGDDPVAIANRVRYGLTGSVYTNDVRRAHRVAAQIDSGYVWINGTAAHFLGQPFGGFKNSGLGREESLEELLSYTQVKSVNVVL